jgi:transposase
MDNALIQIHGDIKANFEQRGYDCAYLLLYSPELNPIE